MKQREPPLALDFGWRWKTTPATVRYVRGLGDPEITKSYFLHIWSDGYKECGNSLKEMEVAIRGDFGRIGMRCHQKELINQLDKVLEGLRQFRSSFVPSPMAGGGVTWVEGILLQYMELNEVLLKMEMETLTREPLKLSLFNKHTDFHGRTQNPPSCVLYLSTVCDHLGRFGPVSSSCLHPHHDHL